MRIVLEGKAGHGDVVFFGKNFGWLRSATTIKGRSTGFRSELNSGNSFNAKIAIPGPVDGVLSAVVSGSIADVTLNIITDQGGAIVWSVARRVGDQPVPFKFSVGQFRVEGSVRLVE